MECSVDVCPIYVSLISLVDNRGAREYQSRRQASSQRIDENCTKVRNNYAEYIYCGIYTTSIMQEHTRNAHSRARFSAPPSCPSSQSQLRPREHRVGTSQFVSRSKTHHQLVAETSLTPVDSSTLHQLSNRPISFIGPNCILTCTCQTGQSNPC
jgi:hypothetical protein